eukprot:3368149-Pleurochrysis_carterae.AAC.1
MAHARRATMHGAGASDSARQHTSQARRVKALCTGEGQRTAQAATLDASSAEWTAQGARRRECQREWAGRW